MNDQGTVSKDIWIKFDVVGFHNWPGAPEDYDYLAARHRHIFGFRVMVPVAHSDRQIEFHELKHTCKVLMGADIHDIEFGAQSCEMIAESLAIQLCAHYAINICTVAVDEDGECGAVVSVHLYDAGPEEDAQGPIDV